MTERWQPSASWVNIRRRADMLRMIREFFSVREVLEVDTPTLSRYTITDPHLHSLKTHLDAPGLQHAMYLQTSPEFAMKRLLAAGSGAIYQISKVFRDDEAGQFHNPEFTMLEWYRPDFDHFSLMDEVADLVCDLGVCHVPPLRMTYQQAFIDYAGIDPFDCSDQDVAACFVKHDIAVQGLADVSAAATLWRDVLMSHVIEAALRQCKQAVFIYHYPADQAALARINEAGLAERFELYIHGVEVANGYYELTDAFEQRRRFEHDNALREQSGLPAVELDQHVLSALEAGLPDCAGVALGVDRLLMLACDAGHIDQVLCFPANRA